MREVAWLFRRLRPHLFQTSCSLALATAAGTVATVDPLLMRHLIDKSLPSHRLQACIGIVILIAACFAGRAVFAGASNLLGFRVAQRLGNDMREELLEHMGCLSVDWHERTPLGEKISRFDDDVEQIAQFGADSVGLIVRVIVFFVLNLIIMLRLNAAMTAVVLPLLPLFYLVRRRFKALIQSRTKETRDDTGRAMGTIAEHLGAVPQLQLLGALEARTRDSINGWLQVVRSQWLQRRAEILFSAAVTFVLGVAILLVLGVGTYKFLAGALTIGTLVAFYAYTTRIFEPLSIAMDLYARSERMLASAHRVLEFIEQKPSIQDSGEHTVTKAGFDLVFENVSFGYDQDRFVLRDIELGIRSGEMVAIVGQSGSGKSSLARLMVRQADPVRGSVCIGGRKAQAYTLAALRTLVCYVPQAPILFRGTIRDNLLCASPSATPGQIEDAIQAACLASVIERLAQGIDQPLESGGSGLSGGEQQRLAIARALLRDSAVLILDEATSALDVPTEKAVLRGIRRLRPNCTFVVISHRVSSLRSLERFIVLERGGIAAEGDFLALQARSRLFRSMLDARNVDADAPISPTERVGAYGPRLGGEGDFGGQAI